MWSGHDFIFACTNLKGNKQAMMDATEDQCIASDKWNAQASNQAA
jgi:hypothetical protein